MGVFAQDDFLPSHASVAVLVVVAWGGAGLMVGEEADVRLEKS